jgi:glycosyltransferase involved in cell wall biosynthesis
LAQTFTDFEIIIVDDCSPDASPEICEEYAQKYSRIKVIHNPCNKGLPQTRKVGLDAASGDYILFVDSDDWIEPNMLELLYNKAVSDDLDMVYCGIYRNTDTEQKNYNSPFLDDKIEMIKQISVWDKFTPSLCNKLIKHEIYSKIVFPTASVGEDHQISIQTIHYAEKIGYITEFLYHYYYNTVSLSNSSNYTKLLNRYTNEFCIAEWVIEFLKANYSGYFKFFEPELSLYINSVKMHFIFEKPIRDFNKLHELYPDSNHNIFNSLYRETIIKKTIFFLALYNISLASILADINTVITFALRGIYRILIPKNIRNIIWKKRNMQFDL